MRSERAPLRIGPNLDLPRAKEPFKMPEIAEREPLFKGPPESAKKKVNYIGAPAVFALELACDPINRAFGGQTYVVGSALTRPDWRDVDLRHIMDDTVFTALFPDAGIHWEWDPRWLLLTTALSERLAKATGLPIDFQFQPRTHANERFPGPRNPVGLRFSRPPKDANV